MTITSTRPAAPRTSPAGAPTPLPSTDPHEALRPGEQVVVHGDFGCPWSYLAHRRASVLARSGVRVDWRAVERAPWVPGVRDDRSERYEALLDETRLVTAFLAPGEQLPVSSAGFAPRTRATVAAYAEAYAAGVQGRVRTILFESYWEHGTDVGDPNRLRVRLQPELQGSRSPSPVVREFGHAVHVGGGPLSTHAWRLVRRWDAEWRDEDRTALPVVHVAGRAPLAGARAVEWLAQEILARGLDFDLPPLEPRSAPVGLPSSSWTSGFGGVWLDRSQRAAALRAR